MVKRLVSKSVMKTVLILLIATFMVLIYTESSAEDGSLIQWTDEQYLIEEEETKLCVLRPQISLYESSGKSLLKFGDELTLLKKEGEESRVITKDGRKGYVDTGYIAYVYDKVYFEGHVNVSPKPAMENWDFGSKAGGWRIAEMALVLFYEGDYMYVVTEEGCTGYVYLYDEAIIPYEQYQQYHDTEG